MARSEAFYNFAEDASPSEADLGLLQLMNELRGPQGSLSAREQSNSEGLVWPESANFDRPAQSLNKDHRTGRPALDQGLDTWLEQNLQCGFEQAAQYHMRFIAQEHVEFAEESRHHFIHDSSIATLSRLKRVPFHSELGLRDVLGTPPVNLATSRSAKQPAPNDVIASIAPKSLHAAFLKFISARQDNMSAAILQLVQDVRDPHAWIHSPPAAAAGSSRGVVFEALAGMMDGFRNVALLPLRRYYPLAGQPCIVRATQAYEPAPTDGNHLRLQVGDYVQVHPHAHAVPGFRLGRLVDQPMSAFQVFPIDHTILVHEVAHFAVSASESSASRLVAAGTNPCQDYLHGIQASNHMLSASVTWLSRQYHLRKVSELGALRLDGRKGDMIPHYLALRAHSNFSDLGSLPAMNPAVAPVLDVLRLRLQPSARMSPDHAKAFTTSVDLLIQKVVGLAPGAAMTDDLIALCNLAIGGKEALQTLLRNLYAPVPSPLSFLETLLLVEEQRYPQFVEMVINEVVWLHLICCSPIPSVCLVCPSDAPQGFVWQSSLKSIHTHCLETLHLCIANSTPHHVQHHPLRSVYFAPDLSLHKDDMEPHNRSQTDVWANVDHVLRQLWGQLWDYRCTLAPASVARDAFIDQQLRKFVPPSLRASALVLCQRLPEAARILDEGDLSLDACVLSCIFDAAGLCPRFERKDGPCIGVAGYMIKAFLAPIAPPGQALLPTGHDSSMELCCYLALSLDSSHHVAPNLQMVQPGSCVSIQLLAFVFVHLFRSRQTGAVFSFPLERAVKLKLGLDQPVELSGGCKYLEAMCNYVAKHFEENSKGDALHLVEAARMYKYAKNFEKFAELLVQAISHCIPLPHQYDIALGAAAKAELEALRTEVAAVLKFEVALAAPKQQQQDAFQHWCIVGGVANPKLQYLSQLVSVAYAFEISRKLPFNPAAVLEALQSGPPSGVLDWSKSVLPELRRTPSSCFSNRNPSCLSLIPVDAASVAALADALANADGAHFIQLLATRVGSTCLLLLDALKAQQAGSQRAAREQAQVCNDLLNALMLNHTISADVAAAGAAKFSQLFK